MKALISNHFVPINILSQAIHQPAMLSSEIEEAGREAAQGYADHQLTELVREGQAAGCDAIRVCVTIEAVKW